MNLAERFKQSEGYIIQMRRLFHSQPELSLHEEHTQSLIREQLSQMGIPCQELAPSFGLAGMICGSRPGRTIALRADIDALPVTEETGLPFQSQNPGVMHACGHDAHIAMLLGAARVLNQVKEELAGRVVLLFQAAEETGHGTQEALEYFDSIGGIDQIIGLHIWSEFEEGEILLLPGSVMAGGHGIAFHIKGMGGHGSRPDLVRDPIKAACDLVLKLSSIPSSYYNVLDHCAVSIGQFESGTAGNIIPGEARLKGTARYFKKDGAEAVNAIIRRFCQGTAACHGVEIEFSPTGSLAPVYNSPKAIELARSLVPSVEGLRLRAQQDPLSGSDNMGVLLDKYPGFYGILGGRNQAAGCSYPQHSSRFNIDEKALPKGAQFMAAYAVRYLNS